MKETIERLCKDTKDICPRCGRPLKKRNALSRYADVYICDDCGTDEALRDSDEIPARFSDWAIFKVIQEQKNREDEGKPLCYVVDGENEEVFGEEKFSRRIRFASCDEDDLPHEMPYKYRVKDDDDVIYFWGRCSECDTEGAFAPLDDVGEAYGAVIIEYYNDVTQQWEEL